MRQRETLSELKAFAYNDDMITYKCEKCSSLADDCNK